MPLRMTLLAALCLTSSGTWAELVGIDFGPPGNSPENWTPVAAAGHYRNLIDDTGQPTRVSLNIRRGGTPFNVGPRPVSVPTYAGNLAGIDGNLYQFGGTFEAEISGLEPLEPYDIYVFGLRGGAELTQGVALSGGRGTALTQKAPDSVLAINDQLGSDQRPLSSYARTLTASSNGTIGLNLTGGSRANQTFAIAGLAITGAFPGSAATTGASIAARTEAPSQPAAATASIAARTAAPSQPSASASTAPAAAPRVRSEPQGPDVLGVYLGMPYEEAYAVIREAIPQMPLQRFDWALAQVQKTRITGGPRYDAGFQGKYNSQERNDQIRVMTHMPPNNDRVAGISRYSATGEMLLADLRASLVEKYGEPHLEIPPDTVLRKPYRLYSWSLTPDGKPLKDPLAVTGCAYQQAKNPWDGSGPVTLWDTTEAFHGIYDACGLTFAVATYEHRQNPPLVRGFGVVLFDLNEIRKSARQAWEETDRMATQWEEEKERSISGNKPRL